MSDTLLTRILSHQNWANRCKNIRIRITSKYFVHSGLRILWIAKFLPWSSNKFWTLHHRQKRRNEPCAFFVSLTITDLKRDTEEIWRQRVSSRFAKMHHCVHSEERRLYVIKSGRVAKGMLPLVNTAAKAFELGKKEFKLSERWSCASMLSRYHALIVQKDSRLGISVRTG